MSSYDSNSFNDEINNFDTGDAIFVKGKGKGSWLDLLIRFMSGSSFVHTALLIELRGLWFVVETRRSSQYGYQLVPLEWWFARHKDEEIYIGRMPLRDSNKASKIKTILMDSKESLRPYKLSWLFLTYVLQIWLGFFRPNLEKLYQGKNPLICSTLVQEAWERVGVMKPRNYMTPGCLIDHIGGEKLFTPLRVNDKLTRSRENNTTEPNLGAITV